MKYYITKYRLMVAGIALLAIFTAEVSAQERGAITLDPQKAITQYRHDTWTTHEGLPQNTVSTIVQTPDGYIWIGTQEGLVRFDGVDFKVFDRKNTEALSVSQINQLAVSKDGTLWIGTRAGGVLCYKDGVFVSKTMEDGLTGDTVTSVFVGDEGDVWFGTTRASGLNHLTRERSTSGSADATSDLDLEDRTRERSLRISSYGEAEGLAGAVVTFVTRDAKGDFLVGTNEGVFIFGGTGFTPHPDSAIQNAFVTSFFVDNDGNEWIGLQDGTVLKHEKGKYKDFTNELHGGGSYLRTMIQDARGSLWFAFRGDGLYRLSGGIVTAFTEEEGLSGNVVLALKEGREGGLWIGTSNGLNRLQNGKFETFTTLEGLTGDDARTVHEDASGTIWVGTQGNGVSKQVGSGFVSITTEDGLSSDNIQAIESDASGNVWIGTADAGLNRISPEGVITTYSKKDGMVGNEIFALYRDSKDLLWIATLDGLSWFDGTTFTNLGTDDGLNSPMVTDFAEKASGGMWISTYDGGLYLLENEELISFTTEDGLFSDGILSLRTDSDDNLWIGTYGEGLNVIQDGQVFGVNGRQGLFDDMIFAILEGADGKLWFSSNKGIFNSSREELLAVAKGESEILSSTNYGVSDGLRTAEANGGLQPAAWKGDDGTLWFAMATGVAAINPATIPKNEVVPLLAVSRMVVDSKEVNLNSVIELAAGSDRLEFDYAALSYVDPSKVNHETMLVGQNDKWTPMGSRRQDFFTNLDPGSYTFKIRASNNDGVWSEDAAEIHFVLKPFFYQTTWFMIVSILALMIAVFVAYRARIEQMKARERHLEKVVDERTHDLRMQKEQTERAKEVIEEQADQLKELDRFKTKFFSNISHEFRTPLTMLIGPLENALQGAYGQIGDSMRQQAEIMLRNAQRLMRLINQLLDLSKLEDGKMQLQARAGNVISFLEGLLFTFTPFTDKKNIALTFDCDIKEIDLFFEPDKMEKVFYNLLSNAAKFTPENGKIDVSIKQLEACKTFAKGALEIRVSDTGQGMSADDLPYIFDRFRQAKGTKSKDQQGTGIGLSLVKELIELHQGQIEVESEVGKGTVFTVRLHLGRRHLLDEDIVETPDGGPEGEHEGDGNSNPQTEMAAKSLNFMHEDADSAPAKKTELPENAPTVLIVEDNKDVREYVASILENHYHVKQAEDGVEGLDLAQVLLPDLVVSDVNMPRMNGNEMCQRIKEDDRLNHIPVLLLTARASFDGKMSGLEVGADDYMAKPFNARELVIRTQNLIKLRMQDKQLKVLNEDLEAQVSAQLELIMTEREEYEQQLIVERDRAEASSKLKSSILDNVNHEFRTPLSTILGYSQILVEEAPPELQEFASAVEEGGQRLLRTLNGVIDLANLESTDFETDRQLVELKSELEMVVSHWQSEAQLKGLSLSFGMAEDVPAKILVSPLALSKVLHILFDNAVKFSEEGEIALNVSKNDTTVSIAVRDPGIGIAEKAQAEIFGAFVQGDTGLTRSHEGTGIGLSIAHRLVERMDGTISIKSTTGEGATFTFSIPLSPTAGIKTTDREAVANSNKSLPPMGVAE